MKKLAIDFAPPSLARSWYRLGRRGAVLLALGALSCGASIVLGSALLAQQRRLPEQLAAVRASVKPAVVASAVATPAPLPAPLSAARAAAINGAIVQLNVPWPALREAIGAATPAGVALLSLEPDAARHSVKISAETRDADAMIAYVARLKRDELFGDVLLLRHEINEADPNRPLRFEIDAAWNTRGSEQ